MPVSVAYSIPFSKLSMVEISSIYMKHGIQVKNLLSKNKINYVINYIKKKETNKSFIAKLCWETNHTFNFTVKKNVLVIQTPVQFTVFNIKFPVNYRNFSVSSWSLREIFRLKIINCTGISITSTICVKSF